MSGISRRALFGLSAGAAAAANAAPVAAERLLVITTPIMGNAGEVYAQAVRVGTLAQHSRTIADDLNHLRRVYAPDLDAFRVASAAWRSSYLPSLGGEIGRACEAMIDEALK